MEKDYIDRFFDSMSEDVLKEKWKKYEEYSEIKNKVKVSDLLENWNLFYENTFSIEDSEIDLNQNINIEKSESSFGLFYLHNN